MARRVNVAPRFLQRDRSLAGARLGSIQSERAQEGDGSNPILSPPPEPSFKRRIRPGHAPGASAAAGAWNAHGRSRLFNWATNFLVSLLVPIALAAGAGAVFELFAGFGFMAFLLTAKWLPETAARTALMLPNRDICPSCSACAGIQHIDRIVRGDRQGSLTGDDLWAAIADWGLTTVCRVHPLAGV